MEKVTERFGDFIKRIRTSSIPKTTLKQLSEKLNVPLTLLSDIENNRKKPFDKEKIKTAILKAAAVTKEFDNDVTVFYMQQNYRNYADILRFAKKFLYRLGPNYEDNSISMRQSDGRPHVLEGNYTPSEAVDALIIATKHLNANWGDWFVLCRTNADIELFKTLFEKKGIPTDTFKQSELTNSQIEERLKNNTVKILTVHSAKGMEAPYVLSYNIRAYNDDEAKVCYVSATRARDFLIWAKMPPKRKRKNSGITNWE